MAEDGDDRVQAPREVGAELPAEVGEVARGERLEPLEDEVEVAVAVHQGGATHRHGVVQVVVGEDLKR